MRAASTFDRSLQCGPGPGIAFFSALHRLTIAGLTIAAIVTTRTGTRAVLAQVAPKGVGEVAGRVTAAEGEGPLSGAIVSILGTRLGATTKQDGTFRIPGVSAGLYSVRVRRIGYQAMAKDVTVAAGTVTVDFSLRFIPTQIEELVVTGNLSAATAKAVPSAVSVIGAEEIEARGIVKTEEIFKTIPGVSVLADGQFNYGATINIRGGNSIYSSTAKVLVDGVEVAADYAVNDISPESIERIEVFRGPQASTIYGSAASGGLIHIITKKGDYGRSTRPQIEMKISGGMIESKHEFAGSGATTDNSVAITGGSPDFSYRVGAGYATQGDWVKNGNEKNPNAFGNIRTTQGALLLEAGVRFSSRSYGWFYNQAFETIAPSIFHGLNDTKEYNLDQTQAFSIHALYRASKSWKHEITAGFDRHNYEYYSTLPRDTLGTNYIYTDNSSTPSLKYHMGWDQALGRTVSSAMVLGADYASNRFVGYYWEGVGDPNSGTIPESGGDVVTYLGYRHSTAFYGQEILGFGQNLFVTFGLRADRQLATSVHQGFSWSPRVGIAYSRTFGQLTAKVRGSYGTVPSEVPAYALLGQNLPDFIAHPNPNLRPPRLTGTDVGLELYFGRKASMLVTYYNQRPKDQIDFVSQIADSAGATVGMYQNIGEIHNKGWEFEGRLYLGRLTLLGAYSPVNGRITQLGPDYSGALLVGDRLINVPEWTASFTAGVNLPKTSLVLTANATGKHLNYTYYKLYAAMEDNTYDPADDREKYIIDYPSHLKFNLSASHQLSPRFQAFVSVQDLFNNGATEVYDYYVNKSRVSKFGLRIRP